MPTLGPILCGRLLGTEMASGHMLPSVKGTTTVLVGRPSS